MSLPGIKEPIENLLPNILGRLGKENPSQRQRKGCLCAAQVRCDVLSFGTISIRYAQESSTTIIANHFHYCHQHAQVGMVTNSFTFIQEHGVIPTLTSRHTTFFFKGVLGDGTPPCLCACGVRMEHVDIMGVFRIFVAIITLTKVLLPLLLHTYHTCVQSQTAYILLHHTPPHAQNPTQQLPSPAPALEVFTSRRPVPYWRRYTG